MTRIVVKSKVGADGVLQLNVPVGPEEANREVQVTIEPAPPKPTTQEDWQAFIRATAGAWQGDFERPPQGEYEKRDEL
jgi:hypothetical protein